MLTILPEGPALLVPIRQINEAAFGRPNEAALVEALRQSDSFIPELSLVAELNGEPVGHILFPKVTVESPEASFDALALAPMAVLPSHQRAGIGSQLVRAGLEACHQLGHPVVIVLGHPWFYPRFGFRPASQFRIQPPFPVRDEVFMVHGPEDRLRQISGTVRYPSAFSQV